MRDLVIVGAGGFGRETVDTVKAINAQRATWRLLGVIDDAPSSVSLERLSALDLPHLGGMAALPRHVAVAVCVGDPTARERMVQEAAAMGAEFPTLIHPSTTMGSPFVHGNGLITLAGVSIGSNVTLGDHVHLNAHVVIGHDAELEHYVSVNPNATISGSVHVGRGSLIGAASVTLQGVSLGSQTIVGAAACVTKDVHTGQTVKGVPAR